MEIVLVFKQNVLTLICGHVLQCGSSLKKAPCFYNHLTNSKWSAEVLHLMACLKVKLTHFGSPA